MPKGGSVIPKNTRVHEMYESMRHEGMEEGKAARIAQSKTGKSLATGKPPKHPAPAKKHRKEMY